MPVQSISCWASVISCSARKVVHGRPAVGNLVVIHDHVAAGRKLRVERFERDHRRFVHVAVQAEDRKALDRGARQGVAEPALQEAHLVVQEAVAGESLLDRLERDGQLVVFREA